MLPQSNLTEYQQRALATRKRRAAKRPKPTKAQTAAWRKYIGHGKRSLTDDDIVLVNEYRQLYGISTNW